MKTFLPFIASVLLLSYPLVAQDTDSLEVDEAAQEVEQTIDEVSDYVERNAEFGAKLGLNFSSLNDAQVLNPDPQTNAHFGLFGRYLWSERFSGKAELLYSTLGARSDEFSVFDDYSIHLHYLQLVLTGEFEVANGFRLELGPYLGVLVGSRQSFGDFDPSEVRLGALRSNPGETNFIDVGFVIGGNYTFDSGFGIGARYQQGFADALGDDFFSEASGANTALQISTHFTF